MDIVRNSAPRAGRIFAALGVLTASVASAAIPTLVSADTITTRSIALSSSKTSTAGVAYTVAFNTVSTTSTGAFVIDFCDNASTAAIGTTCTAPAGLDVGNPPSTTGSDTVTRVDSNTVKVVLATPVTTGNQVSVVLGNLTNSSAAATMFARIVSYEDGTTNYHYTNASNLGTHLDDGSVALPITDGFSVNGSVLESLTFCTSGADFTLNAIGTGCSSNVTNPNLTLGAGGVLTNARSEGTIQTQVSTNAVGGVAVNLKSSTTGGGLARAGAGVSDIAPMTSAGAINTGDAKFGLKLANVTGVTAANAYNTTTFYLGAAATSTYGEKVYGTAGPVSDGVANLTFGANTSNLTPAGTYSAALNLIATGTF